MTQLRKMLSLLKLESIVTFMCLYVLLLELFRRHQVHIFVQCEH